MTPEQFIAQKLVLTPMSLWPDISLYLPTAQSGLSAWLKAIGHTTPPYWAYAWAGGSALALHLRENPKIIANKTILDLGAGSGLVGIAAAKLGAAAVFAYDVDPLAQIATQLNAKANGVVITPVPTLLHTDLVLAGDVFYDAPTVQAVLPLLQELAQTGTEVLIGDPFRPTLPRASLLELAQYNVPDMGSETLLSAGIFTLA